MRIFHTPLIDGPLIEPISSERLQTVQRMAACLIADDAAHDRRGAVACLLRHGFHSLKVAILVDDARALAFQDVVAEAMKQ